METIRFDRIRESIYFLVIPFFCNLFSPFHFRYHYFNQLQKKKIRVNYFAEISLFP